MASLKTTTSSIVGNVLNAAQAAQDFAFSRSPSYIPNLKEIPTQLQTTVNYNGSEHNVYKANGKYYIVDDFEAIEITDKNVKKTLDKNDEGTVNLNKNGTGASTPSSKTKYNTGALGGANNYNSKTVGEEPPKPMSAAELAKYYNIDYNRDNILADYNQKTNDYYNSAVKEQDDLRTDYLRDNTQYAQQLANNYLDSYNNVAPTRANRATLAANILNTQLASDNLISSDDYSMLQGRNYLEEQRKAELANNPEAAEQYYNNIGTYLSTLSTNKHASDVQQYVNKINHYADLYAADRLVSKGIAQGNAAKYAGLVNAASTNASSTANNYLNNDWKNLYNYYYTTRGNSTYNADSNVSKNLLASTGVIK